MEIWTGNASLRRQPEFPRREHAHDVETQVGGAEVLPRSHVVETLISTDSTTMLSCQNWFVVDIVECLSCGTDYHCERICATNSVSSGSQPRCVSPSFPPPRTDPLPSPDCSAAGPSDRAPAVGACSARRKPGRTRLSSSGRRHAALSARSNALSTGTTPRTGWDDAGA